VCISARGGVQRKPDARQPAREGEQPLSCFGIHDKHALVILLVQQQCARRRELDVESPLSDLEVGQERPGIGVPKKHAVILSDGKKSRLVRAPDDAHHRKLMSFKDGEGSQIGISPQRRHRARSDASVGPSSREHFAGG
jgi:hypothetical protein